MASWMKNTGMLLPTRPTSISAIMGAHWDAPMSQLPSSVYRRLAKPERFDRQSVLAQQSATHLWDLGPNRHFLVNHRPSRSARRQG